jgi:TolA-binding protein
MHKLLIELTLGIMLLNLMGCKSNGIPLSQTSAPTLTQTPNTLPTLTASPSPTPTPTPTPEIRVSIADQALFEGDYLLARQEYLTAYSTSPVVQDRAAALWGLGRVEFSDGYYDQALVYLKDLISTYSDSPYAHRANFLLGKSYDGLQRYADAAIAYNDYIVPMRYPTVVTFPAH